MKTKTFLRSLLVLSIVAMLMTSCYREDGVFSSLPMPDEDEELIENNESPLNGVRMTLQQPEVENGRVKFVGAVVENPLNKDLTYGFMWFERHGDDSGQVEIGRTLTTLSFSMEVDDIPYDTYYTACVLAIDPETEHTIAAGELAFIVPKPEVDK